MKASSSDPIQAEAMAFMGEGTAYDPPVGRVDTLETHGAVVFLAGDLAYKMKKAIRFDYMDFSTLERRRHACARELEINRPHAPEIYLRLVAVTRESDGRLALGGAGAVVEWCIEMRRFPQSDLLDHRVSDLSPALCHQLAEAVFRYHGASTAVSGVDMPARLVGVAREMRAQLSPHAAILGEASIAAFADGAERAIAQCEDLLNRRAAAGYVRRCHGDLHLGNVVLWRGAPVLFDAIEFDEDMATIDTLYDLAFLLMDLDHRGRRDAASRVLSRYLWHSRDLSDLAAMAAMPVFLALRSAVRAMVSIQRAAQQDGAAKSAGTEDARRYLAHAIDYLKPSPPSLVAVGGLSGTGKSTLAAAMAPHVGAAPGAVHLRTDLERKAMAGAGETQRLPTQSYTAESSRKVYALVLGRAEAVLRAGHSVVIDGVFAAPEERAEAEQLASRLGIAFKGLWLSAPPEVLRQRVEQRRDDASDADVSVVGRQLGFDLGLMAWARVDASASPEATLSSALSQLGLSHPATR